MSIRTVTRTVVSSGLIAGALVVPLATGAGARARDASTELRQRCLADFDRRTRPMPFLRAAVAHSSVLSAGHRAALTTGLGNDAATLAAQRAVLAAAATLADVKAACLAARQTVRLVRFDVVKVGLVAGTDRLATAMTDVQTLLDDLDATLADLEGQGFDVSAARAALAAAQDALDALADHTAGLGDGVVALDPSTGLDGLHAAATSLRSGLHDLRSVRRAVAELDQQLAADGSGDAGGGGPSIS